MCECVFVLFCFILGDQMHIYFNNIYKTNIIWKFVELSNKQKSDTHLYKLLLFVHLKKINCARVYCLCLLLLDTITQSCY